MRILQTALNLIELIHQIHLDFVLFLQEPKVLGVSVMNQAESLSTAISIVLSRLKVLPRTVYYNNP